MFKIVKYLGGHGAYPDALEIPVTADVEVGTALTEAGAKATGDVSVAYVTAAPAKSGEKVICYRVTPDIVFEAPASVVNSNTKLGNAVTISSDAKGVTATAVSSGKGAKIIDANGAAAAGDTVHVVLA